MEEMSRIASAYYANSSPDFQKKVKALFDEMDTDRNGKISRKEFDKYVSDSNWPEFKHDLFMDLDRNGDGMLNFKETFVFFYMNYMRDILRCDGNNCGVYLMSTYFTCVECFHKSNNSSNTTVYNATYDLCIKCYNNKNFSHRQHKTFLDNYALLKSLRSDLVKTSSRSSCEGSEDAANENPSRAGKGKEIVAVQSSRLTHRAKEDVAYEISSSTGKRKEIVAVGKKPSNTEFKLLAQGLGIGANVATIAALIASCTIL